MSDAVSNSDDTGSFKVRKENIELAIGLWNPGFRESDHQMD